MFYKIVEVSTDKASGHTYVLVHFWRDKAAFDTEKPPDRANDFLMQLRPTSERIVTNAAGWFKTKDGQFIDPKTLDPDKPHPEWELETFDLDLPAEIKANIAAYWVRAEDGDFPTNHTDPHIQRNESDPHGVLARTDVMALRGAGVEKA